ncbi:MAG: hypothetical protein ACTHJT_15095 [Cytophaga sp.]|uniref:hypothetical protein n=1 Tax=Cytophaga sp. TaxID=29535 RepID=UPI003F7EB7A4
MIKTSTTLFAVAPLVLLVIAKIIPGEFSHEPLYWLAYIAEAVLVLHLIAESKKTYWLYSVTLILVLIGSIGALVKIMHLPLVGPMLICGILSTMMMVCLFLYNSKQATHYGQFILSLFLFFQLGMLAYKGIFHDSYDFPYFYYLHYPLVAVCSILLFKKKYVNLGDRNLILYLLVHSSFVILDKML